MKIPCDDPLRYAIRGYEPFVAVCTADRDGLTARLRARAASLSSRHETILSE